MTRGAPQGSLLGPVLYSSDLEVVERAFMKFADDTK